MIQGCQVFLPAVNCIFCCEREGKIFPSSLLVWRLCLIVWRWSCDWHLATITKKIERSENFNECVPPFFQCFIVLSVCLHDFSCVCVFDQTESFLAKKSKILGAWSICLFMASTRYEPNTELLTSTTGYCPVVFFFFKFLSRNSVSDNDFMLNFVDSRQKTIKDKEQPRNRRHS